MSSIIPTCRSSSCIDGVVPSGRRRQCRRPGGLGPRGCAIEGGIAGGIEGGPAVREGETSVAGRSASGIPYARKLKVRSEEHTSELQSLMRHSYAVFCLKKKQQIILHANTATRSVH